MKMARKKKKKTQRRISTDKMLRKIDREERTIIREEKKLERIAEKIFKEEKKIEDMEHRLIEEEHDLIVSLGKMKLKGSHVLDFFKIVGGSLVGTSFGAKFIGTVDLATTVPWENVIAILIMSLVIGGALIYKAEKKRIVKMKHPTTYLALRLVYIWIISIAIGGMSIFLFLTEPVGGILLAKTILLGSYPALAGAIGFNFV